MASSIDQHWMVQHQTRCRFMMDNPAYPTDQQHQPQPPLQFSSTYSSPPVHEISFSPAANQTTTTTTTLINNTSAIGSQNSPTYWPITNAQHQQQHSIYSRSNQSAAFPGGQLATATGDNSSGGPTNCPAEGTIGIGPGSADYYASECRNSHSIGAYDHSVRGPSSAMSAPALFSSPDLAHLSHQHHHNQQQQQQQQQQHYLPLHFGGNVQQAAAATTPASMADHQQAFYQSSAHISAIHEPYYLPAAYPADYQQQDQYHFPPAYVSTNYERAEEEMKAAEQETSAQQSASSGAANQQHQQATAMTTTTVTATTITKTTTTSTSGGPQTFTILKEPSSTKRRALLSLSNDRTANQLDNAVPDSHNQLPCASYERKIKNNKQEIGQPQGDEVQQSDIGVGSCQTNQVQAGSLGIISRRKNATRETTAILKEWLDEHGHNPYPSKGEKIMLSCVTKMSMTQVSTWFANARRRMKKEKRFYWSNGVSNITPGSGPSSLTKVKNEYAKAVLASSTGSTAASCPALRYFMQKHQKQQKIQQQASGVIGKHEIKRAIANAVVTTDRSIQVLSTTAQVVVKSEPTALTSAIGIKEEASAPGNEVRIKREPIEIDSETSQPSSSSSSSSPSATSSTSGSSSSASPPESSSSSSSSPVRRSEAGVLNRLEVTPGSS